MRHISLFRLGVFVCGLAVSALNASSATADDYAIDPVHSSVTFKCEHMGISWVHGRFNAFSGSVSYDKANLAKSSFEMTIKADSVDSGNKQRDAHLMNADFFDAKQFANITFKSTSVKPVKDGLEVEGDFTMHGTTKKIKFVLKGGKEADMRGKKIIGFWTDLTLKRSDYAMKEMPGLGDEVPVSISFEAGKK
jgi:polyisoprenoid-binding protein YceI